MYISHYYNNGTSSAYSIVHVCNNKTILIFLNITFWSLSLKYGLQNVDELFFLLLADFSAVLELPFDLFSSPSSKSF